MALMRSIATVGGWTMVSRVLGFARDAMMAGVLGAGPAAEAFVVAFRLPNLFRRLFAEGALNAALVPIYAKRLERDGKESAIRFGGEAAVLLVLTMLVLTVLAMAFMPFVILVLAPGFGADADTFALAVALSTITFPYLTFMALSALLSGMLNTVDRFGAAAAAPLLLNIVLIIAMGLSLSDLLPTLPAFALAWGVFIGGVLQFGLIAWDCHRAGILVHLPRPRLSPDIISLLRRMGPGVLSAGVSQINTVVSTMLASLLPAGAIAHLYYADRVAQLPLGVIGVAISVALLPLLSRQLSAKDMTGASESLNRALEIGLLFTLPATAALIAMPMPVVDILFQRGAFSPEDAQITAAITAAMAIGLPSVVLAKILSPAFFARGDTRTPLILAAISMAANVLLAVLLMQAMGSVGIALAASLAAWINAGMMAAILSQRGHLPLDARFRRRLPRLLLAAITMGLALYAGVQFIPQLVEGTLVLRIAALAGLVLIGAILYFTLAQVLGGTDLRDVKRALTRRRRLTE
ncbi:MAG TPA: murein biosynthesis integral membrane protein MurJ [Rhodospirillaceae bacterium]|nr:murein biosynthesis integral membrane protein MurJ [Rhodospirillaceae bacterium]MAX63351.1 murein biosynthesis integral membrane protein MurJ [Rhodospirillaceae bacterium]MBB59331.1 murein biosynthesis integral membrane protein MurJ [Rhodospirillaceae bacterium]HAE00405.1 murein biosynthesis integral membrane protein MurJ [Rhodospirillaceae bacterium]|tara:strand:- start:37061 stop:38626 length:1566 start_codon:yes stop_codon:yes gene_type:complete